MGKQYRTLDVVNKGAFAAVLVVFTVASFVAAALLAIGIVGI